jgi:hypothetical protein
VAQLNWLFHSLFPIIIRKSRVNKREILQT